MLTPAIGPATKYHWPIDARWLSDNGLTRIAQCYLIYWLAKHSASLSTLHLAHADHTHTSRLATMASAAPSSVVEVTSPEHFQQQLAVDLQRISLINFWAPWAEPCKQMNEVVLELAKRNPQLLVLNVRTRRVRSIKTRSVSYFFFRSTRNRRQTSRSHLRSKPCHHSSSSR